MTQRKIEHIRAKKKYNYQFKIKEYKNIEQKQKKRE